MKATVLAVRFALELALLAGLALGGWALPWAAPARWIAAVVAPIAGAAVWGAWIAPKAVRRLADPARLGLEVVLFGVATTGFALAGRPSLAAAFAALVLVHLIAMLALGLRGH